MVPIGQHRQKVAVEDLEIFGIGGEHFAGDEQPRVILLEIVQK